MEANLMSHKAEIVKEKTRKLSNAAVVFYARCCGDPSTDIAHTVYVEGMTEEQIDADVARHLTRAESLHAAQDLADRVLEKYQAKVN
jgi:hypothetical protein